MKSYSAPKLVPVGSVIEATNAGFDGRNDADRKNGLPAGSLGFNL
jgi:hypothetical protein